MSAPPKYTPHTCGTCGQSRQTLNGAWLRWQRERAGVGLRELARRSGFSAAHLSNVERGKQAVSVRVEAAYLGVPKSATPYFCTRPPAGWTCSRINGHDGPCAALPKRVRTSRAPLSPREPAA